MELETMIGGVAAGWIAGLGFGLVRPQFARLALLVVIFSIVAILAVFLIFESQSWGWSWLALTYIALAGVSAGVVGPALFADDRLFAVGLSLISAPFVAFFLFYVAAIAACSVGGCL
ncbi:MAG: hypothetical protein DCF16_14995 [Alphaproteobacteria bacterium]|nr:MAG: hypothetical protein DCF16_14995 [Alphaproteobacteria bacterium]